MNTDAAIFYAQRLQEMCKETKCDTCPFNDWTDGPIRYRMCHIAFPKEAWRDIKDER